MMKSKIPLREGEKIIAIMRRHWFNIALVGIVDIFIGIVVSIIVIASPFFIADTSTVSVQNILPIGFFILGFVGLILWMHFFSVWSDHWLDAWIITNERMIDIEQKGFFNREVSSFPLEKIQDVTYTVAGIVPMWLHFGDVRIQTASITNDLIMEKVPFPDVVKENLMKILSDIKKGKSS